ncbi:unnamed protein product [Bemisia tabaci]|uniref:Uncharacterized protein n=1 Tax=Bemisia tabaci TaxID=7038 RepID=A0A9N9ZZH9_BEMTA|nr:unnamed protein product [Bemisia tabaci]
MLRVTIVVLALTAAKSISATCDSGDDYSCGYTDSCLSCPDLNSLLCQCGQDTFPVAVDAAVTGPHHVTPAGAFPVTALAQEVAHPAKAAGIFPVTALAPEVAHAAKAAGIFPVTALAQEAAHAVKAAEVLVTAAVP